MRAVLIVVAYPFDYQLAGVAEIAKDVLVEAFIAAVPVEALVVGGEFCLRCRRCRVDINGRLKRLPTIIIYTVH